MIIEVSGEYVQEINFENVFEHISFETFVTDVENGFLHSNEYIRKQWFSTKKQEMNQSKSVSNTVSNKTKIWSETVTNFLELLKDILHLRLYNAPFRNYKMLFQYVNTASMLFWKKKRT